MYEFEYEYPNEIELDNHQNLTLSGNDIKDEKYFTLVVLPEKINNVVNVLRKNGFMEARPAWDKGEAYSLSKVVDEPWEMHVRLYNNGSIYSHIEVRRDYFEHLDTRYVWPLIDEIVNYIQCATDAFVLVHTRTKRPVIRIISKKKIRISPPASRTEWKPIVEIIGVVTVTTFAIYGIMKLLDYIFGEKEE